MYLGRYRIGESVQLGIWCRSADGTPTLPDEAPTVKVYNEAGTALRTLKLPIMDRYQVTGWFSGPLFLGSGLYDEGHLRIRYEYELSSVAFASEDSLEIVDGGTDDGVGISSHYYRRPQNAFVLIQSEGGRILKKRNPRLP